LREWRERIESDNFIRKSLGAPAPSLDELHLLLSIPKTPDVPMGPEKVDEVLDTSKFEQAQLIEMRQLRKTRMNRYNKSLVWSVNDLVSTQPFTQVHHYDELNVSISMLSQVGWF